MLVASLYRISLIDVLRLFTGQLHSNQIGKNTLTSHTRQDAGDDEARGLIDRDITSTGPYIGQV